MLLKVDFLKIIMIPTFSTSEYSVSIKVFCICIFFNLLRSDLQLNEFFKINGLLFWRIFKSSLKKFQCGLNSSKKGIQISFKLILFLIYDFF